MKRGLGLWTSAMSLVAALGLLTGCSISVSDDADSLEVQSCKTDDDCSQDASCQDGICVAGSTAFDSVLFEVSVPNSSSAGPYAGMRYLQTLTGLRSEGERLDLELSLPTEVEIVVTPPPCRDESGEAEARLGGECPSPSASADGRTCAFSFGQTPLEVALTPKERALGLTTTRYRTTTDCFDEECDAAVARLTVPPGEYDVYLRPDPAVVVGATVCQPVPEMFSMTVLEDVKLRLDYALSESKRLDLTVEWPLEGNDPDAFSGWSLDMLDVGSGQRISTVATLDPPITDGTLARHSVSLFYVSPPDSDSPGADLVRLQPPEGLVAPTVIVERSALELFSGPAVINHVTTLPQPVEVEVQVLARTSADDPSRLQPMGGTVTLVATELDVLPSGVLASFQRTIEATPGADGVFRASLLPGKYRVRVVPPTECSDIIPCEGDEPLCLCPLAATEVDDFIVASQPLFQAGRSIELAWRTRLTGLVSSASGERVADAEVLALAVPWRPSVLEQALGNAAFVPRATTGNTETSGSFELWADAGSFDISVRPDSTERLAWLVRPNVPVGPGESSLNLEELVLPLPISYQGTLQVDGGAVIANAQIRAFVSLDAEDPTSTVVEVGEATTDDNGVFRLLLPSSLEHGR